MAAAASLLKLRESQPVRRRRPCKLSKTMIYMIPRHNSSVFEWPCCVCSQTRLGPGPRQQGRQVQGEGYLPPLKRSGSGTERATEGRSAQAQRGRLGTLLARARDGVPEQVWFPRWARSAGRRIRLLRLFVRGRALREGKSRWRGCRKTDVRARCRQGEPSISAKIRIDSSLPER
jgi:hypothetical protein